MHFSWAFEAYGKEAREPSCGQGSVDVRDASLGALADALDAARHELNALVTCWKDAVGPEHDSSQGRSNAAHAPDREDDDESDESDDEEDNDDE